MSHFGRSGPPDIRDTYSLLVLNITFRTSADDLFPLFDRYGKVVDIFIPRDRRTGESRGFAFVRYKYADEAQKAVDRLDGRNVDGRDIMVQFAKYGPNAEAIQKGRITASSPKQRGRTRSRTPPRIRYRDDYRDREYRKRSRSRDKFERGRYREKDRDYRRSPSPSRIKSRSRSRLNDEPKRRSRSRSMESASPRRSPSPQRSPPVSRSPTPRRRSSPEVRSPDQHSSPGRSPVRASLSPNSRSVSPRSRSPSPRNSDADVRRVIEITVEILIFDAHRGTLKAFRSSNLKTLSSDLLWMFICSSHLMCWLLLRVKIGPEFAVSLTGHKLNKFSSFSIIPYPHGVLHLDFYVFWLINFCFALWVYGLVLSVYP
eukprot:Gb_39592 [translate_table: standard]